MTPAPISGAPVRDVTRRVESEGWRGACRAIWCCVAPACHIALWPLVAVALIGIGLLVAGLLGCFNPDSEGCSAAPPPPPEATAEAASLSVEIAPTSATAATASLLYFVFRSTTGDRTLWPAGSDGDGEDHLPEDTAPGLLFYDHEGDGVAANKRYSDDPDVSTLYQRCRAICSDATMAWQLHGGALAAPAVCNAFVTLELSQYAGTLDPSIPSTYCYFYSGAVTHTLHPLETTHYNVGLRSRVYSESALDTSVVAPAPLK